MFLKLIIKRLLLSSKIKHCFRNEHIHGSLKSLCTNSTSSLTSRNINSQNVPELNNLCYNFQKT